MKVREVTLQDGERWLVPQGIQRIDTGSTHGWQVRYGGTRLFSDQSVEGRAQALRAALDELFRRMLALDAPVTLQGGPSRGKRSGLPAGVSGPVLRQRQIGGATVRSASLSVLLPRFGGRPTSTTIYIGSEQTYTAQRFEAALARAISLRERALASYRDAATAQRRREARLARQLLRSARTRDELTLALQELQRRTEAASAPSPTDGASSARAARRQPAARRAGGSSLSAEPTRASRALRPPTGA